MQDNKGVFRGHRVGRVGSLYTNICDISSIITYFQLVYTVSYVYAHEYVHEKTY